ncbi:hypothetical protein HZA43_01285 [Candidatus Peregrinibacteria bacterium]|nr:hypothetical protein [Candidatus Peregrinibacteria bacterium]
MVINLSWDLFIIVFFCVIVAYSLIMGRNQTVKIIVSSYIAILAADGIGNLIQRYFIGQDAIASIMGFTNNPNAFVVLKIGIFVLTIVAITTRGQFNIDMGASSSYLLRALLSLTYGVLSAGLMISTILIYASGASLVQEGTVVMNQALQVIYKDSFLVRAMIDNYNVWFSLPAITFVFSSFVKDA